MLQAGARFRFLSCLLYAGINETDGRMEDRRSAGYSVGGTSDLFTYVSQGAGLRALGPPG